MKIALSIPGADNIDLGLPPGVPTGGAGGLDTANNIIGVLLSVILVLAILFFIFLVLRGSINIMTSGGDKERFSHGRERIRYAIIGFIIVFLSFFLINLLSAFFGVDLIKQPSIPFFPSNNQLMPGRLSFPQ